MSKNAFKHKGNIYILMRLAVLHSLPLFERILTSGIAA